MLDVLTRPAVLAPALLVAGYVLYQLLRPSRLPQLPIIGAKPGEWFPLTRARWRNAKDMKTAVEVAYSQYRDQACIMPIAGAADHVMLPPRELQWLVDQPDLDISMHDQIMYTLQLDHTLTDPELGRNPVHVSLVSGLLTRETGNLVPELIDEIEHVVDELWGLDGSFRTICVYDTLKRIIGQATNRVFVGLPLCRDAALLEAGMAFAQDVPLTSTVLRFIWPPMRPFVAPLLTLPNRIHTNQFYKIMRPEVLRRLADYDARQRTGTDATGAEKKALPSNDFLQWSVNQAHASGDPYMSKPDTLAGRILLLNFASIHTSSFAITHAILDLASSRQEYIDELRDEITTVLAEHGGEWNKRALAAMPKLDSVFRESQRVNSFVTLASIRSVVKPEGVTTPSGLKIPKGLMVCAPSYPVFHDPELYPDPHVFKPFRFAEKRIVPAEANANGDAPSSSYVQRARQAFASTSPEYTAFGHGRHACPGRFFASSELKLMLAYLVTNYDFEIQERRAENLWFGMNRIPPMAANIRIRRRG
ncbi:Uu.00g094420.m01.CDS01 [Anthostomella pinea]|uniref:Uu.00g094420.m01.CDS01 n=1 Tax=Anthostomella pinea TaxID=933095 RepID=A0AAI8VNM3_9PEZI|nr:Uu.00g094420.m01.CDS01 [Anthostomella pinea]